MDTSTDSPTSPTTFLITGANRGIGLELTRQALARGDHVVATCRRPEPADALHGLAEEHGDAVHLLPFDVTSGGAARRTLDALGGRALDVLVNNAGVYGGDRQGPEGMDYEAWAEALAVNTMAPFRLTTTLRPALLRSSRPRVVTVSSVMGSIAEPSEAASSHSYAYSSSKAAVNKVMRMLADEMRDDGIVVVPVHPGWVRTDMGGPEADLSPEESAAGLLALIDRLRPEDSGRFWAWDGAELPW